MTSRKASKLFAESKAKKLREFDQLGGQIDCNAAHITPELDGIALEFNLNGREVVRADVTEFQGRLIVNIRRWFRAKDGTLRPTTKGIACALRHLPALTKLVIGVLALARKSGLLPDEGQPDAQ